MCGLFGCFSRGKPIDESLIQKGILALQHRGPDQHGYWISPERKVALGQTRLSINDLSHIQLPITNMDGSIRVIANAEIYNFPELKKELISKGYQFKTSCDIEVIPHLYEAYGINFIHKLRGEFSFILWDDKQKSFFAVRDRFGIKPLYYAVKDDFVFFSSEIPALLDLKITPNTWNQRSLYDYTHLSLPYTKNLFSGVLEVPPAHFLLIKEGERHLKPYWDIHYASDPGLNEENIIEAIRTKLIEATTIRTKADVPVGCYLSGGIDSSALLGIATQYSQRQIEAFTIAFDNPMVNESEIAERTAKHLNIKIHTVSVSENDLAENFFTAVKQTCFPMPNTAGVARYLLSQFAHKNQFKTVLSGEGADEVFLGYWGALIEASEDPRINSNFMLSDAEKEALLQQLPLSRNPACYPKALADFQLPHNPIPSWLITQGYFNAKHRHLLNDSLLAEYTTYNPYISLFNDLNMQNKYEHFDQVQLSSYTWMKSFFPNTMLNWIGDRAEMANSIESRQPFLDHELFELMARVPTTLKIKNGVGKYLLREATRPFVTDEIYRRKKFMFQAPPLTISPQSVLYRLIKSTILDGIDKVPVYDKQKVLTLIDYAEKTKDLPIHEKAELGFTLTSLASMVVLSDHYQLG